MGNVHLAFIVLAFVLGLLTRHLDSTGASRNKIWPVGITAMLFLFFGIALMPVSG